MEQSGIETEGCSFRYEVRAAAKSGRRNGLNPGSRNGLIGHSMALPNDALV